jgi:outer membrane lipoprotein-sorting protein
MKIIFTVCTTLLFLSSCATYMRARSSGDAKSGINIITSASDSITVTIGKNSTPLQSQMIFDGTAYNSPYKVYKYYLPRMYKSTDLNITAYNKTKSVHINRQKDEGWFWIDGLVVWMYESIAGKLTYYNDLDVSSVFKKG